MLCLPWGAVKRLASPDGSKILYGVPYEKGRSDGPQLWIEDSHTHKRTKLFDIGSTLCAAWSPDGSAFYVNNHWASDREQAYIYDVVALQRLDIGASIGAADPESRRFASGHAYYEVTRWMSDQDVSARFFGHTDEPPVVDFDFRYRVSRSGAVKRLSKHVQPVKP